MDVPWSSLLGDVEGTFCSFISLGRSYSAKGSCTAVSKWSGYVLMLWRLIVGGNSSVSQLASGSNKFDVPPTENEKEVYATFLSTRIGTNSEEGEFEHDWYFNSTRVLIHRLLRNPDTRTHRRVVVLPLSPPQLMDKVLVTENVAQWKQDRLTADGAIVKLVPILQIPDLPSREATYSPPSQQLISMV
jgi:hypothetical protein